MSILTELIERLSNDDLKDILKKLLFEANDKDFISMDGTGSDNPVRGSVTMQLGTGFNWFNPSSNYSQYINSFSDYLEISTSNSSTGDITGITYHPRDVFVYSNYAGFKGFRGSDYWGANISSDTATDNNIFPQVGWVREKNALKMDKPVFPYNVNTRVVLADGSTKPLSEIVTDISGKLDKPTTDGTWVVTRTAGVSGYADASTLGKNIFNANLVLTTDRSQNLGGYKLSFTNGRFSVPALELEVKSSNSISNTIWSDGVKVKHTNNLGITSDIGGNIGTSNVTSLGTYTYTQAHAWTHNTGGFSYKLLNIPSAVTIKDVLIRTSTDDVQSATAVEILADDGATSKYANDAALDAAYPTAINGFELLCPNISTTNFPDGLIYKKTAAGWKVEKLFKLSDV